MSTQYSCSVRIENGYPGAITDVTFKHRWSGDPGSNQTFLLGTIEGNSDSVFERIDSGSDGYDYWSIAFNYGGNNYSIDEKRCSLNSLDKNSKLTFRIQWKDGSNPIFQLTMNSDPCSETFSEKKI